jgi:hypothetical protein
VLRIHHSPRVLLACIGTLALAMSAPCAYGEPNRSDDLFQQGKALLETGTIHEACEKFAESLSLARRGGTLLNLAVCREKELRHATALRLFLEARELAVRDGREDRISLANDQIDEIRAKLSWLTVVVSAEVQVTGLVIELDGENLPEESWGTPEPIDPGTHVVAAMANGRTRFETKVHVGDVGDKQTVEVPPLASEAPPATAPASAAPAPSTPPAADKLPPPVERLQVAAPQPPSWHRPVGFTALGAGAATLAVGAVYGVKAIVDSAQSLHDCPDNPCPSGSFQKNQDASHEARIADFTIPAGLLATAVGIYLLLWKPSPSPRAAPSGIAVILEPNGAGASVRATW